VSNYLARWTDFGTRVWQTQVLAQNSNYSGVFFSGVCQKRHYRYPIVAFYINTAIGTKKRHYSVCFPAQSQV